MVQRGVALSTKNIITQLTAKFPLRMNRVLWPDQNRIDELRNIIEKTAIDMDIDEYEEGIELVVEKQDDLM